MVGLGIESTCDETSLALVKDGREVLLCPTLSQEEIHREYGGVVPELASRAHLEKFPLLIEKIKKAYPLEEISYIALSHRPGLLGSLLVGYQTALALRRVLKKPLYLLDHLQAHIAAIYLGGKKWEYPFLALLLSGGHTILYEVESLEKWRILGETQDDAIGEALDKGARLLGLGYPGGPQIQKMAEKVSPEKIQEKKNPFPPILKEKPQDKIAFSYSGIKTSLLYFLKSPRAKEYSLEEICYFYQERIFDLVIRNITTAISLKKNIKQIIVAGGVVANIFLREKLEKLSQKKGIPIIYPPIRYCTDNGAMVAALGYLFHVKQQGKESSFHVKQREEL